MPSMKDIIDNIKYGNLNGATLYAKTAIPGCEQSPILQFGSPIAGDTALFYDCEVEQKFSYVRPTNEDYNSATALGGILDEREHVAYLQRNGDLYVCRNTHYGCFPENANRIGYGYWFTDYPPTRTNVRFFEYGYKFAFIVYRDNTFEIIYIDQNGERKQIFDTYAGSCMVTHGVIVLYDKNEVYGYTDDNNFVFNPNPITIEQYIGKELYFYSNIEKFRSFRLTTIVNENECTEADYINYRLHTTYAYIDKDKNLWVSAQGRMPHQKLDENVTSVVAIIGGAVLYAKGSSTVYVSCATANFVIRNDSSNLLNDPKYYIIPSSGWNYYGGYGYGFNNSMPEGTKVIKPKITLEFLTANRSSNGNYYITHLLAWNTLLLKSADGRQYLWYHNRGIHAIVGFRYLKLGCNLNWMYDFTSTSGATPKTYHLQLQTIPQEPKMYYDIINDTILDHNNGQGNVVNYV